MSSVTTAAPPEVRQRALQEELRELLDVVGAGPLADLLIERAFRLRATDIHLDPTESGLRIRIRVDGLLHDVLQLPTTVTPQMISRLKLMGGMDITERRLAQDGHISVQVLENKRDIRVGGGPTIFGERLVLRLMPDGTAFDRQGELEELGFDDRQLELVRRYSDVPNGMILSVGPVGSGKSTTVYSCLKRLNDPTQSLVTIEDPVERRIPGVNQIQVDPKIEFGFVEALRGVLRQDPDVMMIGEIRDPETAHIGVRAGLAGVTVLSTLHANDTAATIDIFRNFGISPMLIADCLQIIIAQRLFRRVCNGCAETMPPSAAERQFLKLPEDSNLLLRRGRGCANCFGTGYYGRTGVFEVMPLTGPVRLAILDGAHRAEIKQAARQEGMQTLEESAAQKVRDGVTTMEELHRVLAAFPAE